METILYVGGFELPDRNAAAQRVVALAKGFQALGHDVVFLNYTANATTSGWKSYFGFSCYETGKRTMYKHLTNIDDVKRIVAQKQITSIIAYNYPACALYRLLQYCRKHNIRCFADVTEWYVAQGGILFRLVKTLDTECRMRYLHPQTDGVIAISEYLYNYYKDKVPTVKIPPLVDLDDPKWSRVVCPEKNQVMTLVYAGRPTVQKEKLDRIIDAVEQVGMSRAICLNVLGLTHEQYNLLYKQSRELRHVKFYGRVSHEEALAAVAKADWTIIIRDNNKVVRAGYPTKVTESISCGTPVIANRFSNIEDHLDDTNSILCEESALAEAIHRTHTCAKKVDCSIFDYHNYMPALESLLGPAVC